MVGEVKGKIIIEIYKDFGDKRIDKMKAYNELDVTAVFGKTYSLYDSKSFKEIVEFLKENYDEEENYIIFDYRRLAVPLNKTDFDNEDLKRFFMYGIEEIIYYPHLLIETDLGYFYNYNFTMEE